MNNSRLLLIISSILLLLLISQQVLAIGVSPGRTTINFESNMKKDISLTITNSEKKEATVVVYVRGELKDYIKLSQQSITFKEGEETKTIIYSVELPSSIEKPGLQKTEIVILEVPKESTIKTEKGQEVIILDSPAVSARLAVISQLYIYVLHPGKYIEAGLDAITNEERVRFIIPITSQGKLGIGNAQATIDIYTSLNEKIATIKTSSEGLESQQTKELWAEWDYTSAKANPGKYKAVATITYDGQTTYSEKNFEIGSKNLEIESITVNNFKLGEIAKFGILVNNEWASELREVSVQIQVNNEEGQIMADFASQNYNIPPLSKAEIVSYWDTVGVKEGTYKGKLILKYEDKIIEKPIEIKVTKNDIEVTGFTGKAVFSKENKLSLQNILIGIVILLVIINGVWFWMFLRKKKKQQTA